MDFTKTFFSEIEIIDEKIKELNLNKKLNALSLLELHEIRENKMLKVMKEALETNDFSLLIEDIATYLDLDEKQVRSNIIPHLDYIRVPEGAAQYFSIEHCPKMSFLDRRIKKWKRVFINVASFEKFLEEHLVLLCPYTTIAWNDRKGRFVEVTTGYTSIPFVAIDGMSLIRKCNIAKVLERKKKEELIRKTKNDITYARKLGLISVERLNTEMDSLMLEKKVLSIPIHNQEIKNYLEKTLHYKIHLFKYKEDRYKPLYSTKKKLDEQETIKPTVLYYFPELASCDE